MGAGLVQRRRGGDDLARSGAFVPPHRERLGRIAAQRVEVLTRVVVRVIEHRHVLAGELDTEPPALHTGEVAGEAMQAQPGRRDALLGEPLRGDAGALELEGLAVPVEVGGEDLALVADEGRRGPGVVGPEWGVVLGRDPGHEPVRGPGGPTATRRGAAGRLGPRSWGACATGWRSSSCGLPAG